jgi:hypothetical protein
MVLSSNPRGSAPPGRTLTIATTDATARCTHIDQFVEMSVLPARIRGILRHGASGFYDPAWQILRDLLLDVWDPFTSGRIGDPFKLMIGTKTAVRCGEAHKTLFFNPLTNN